MGRPIDRSPARLSLLHPPELRGFLALERDRVALGRQAGEEGDLVVDHGTVSRRHLELVWDAAAQAHVAEDLGSKNGTWIDGARVVKARRPLADGSVVRLGDVVLVYEIGPGLAAPDEPAVSRDAVPGDSAAARLLRQTIARAGPDPAHVLLVGPTGTGKEQIARELHRLGRPHGPFVAVSCAELSGDLMQARLFGPGGPGLFQSAEGGTMLLDEIGELPAALQSRLAQVLGSDPPGGDVRIIASTHRDPLRLVDSGVLQRDLYARLSSWEIVAPPLGARRADIVGWIERLHARYLARRPASAVLPPPSFTAEALETILLAAWPGNLRGLDRIVHRLATSIGPGAPITRDELEPLLAPTVTAESTYAGNRSR